MSWWVQTPSPVTKDVGVKNVPLPEQLASREARDQYEVARSAVSALMAVVGRPTDRVIITLSGHANPGHAPTAGWAEETLTVMIVAAPSRETKPQSKAEGDE